MEILARIVEKGDRMATQREPTPQDIDNMKKALVGASILKAATLSKEEEAKVHAELARHGVDSAALMSKIICNGNYCIIVREPLAR
jgi:hypothetical protein